MNRTTLGLVRRSAVILALIPASIALGASSGCSASQPTKAASTPQQAKAKAPVSQKNEVSLSEKELEEEATEQREAQKQWCSYLQDLYMRAVEGETRWPSYDECLGAMTPASPKMLRKTAECSRQALAHFEGDPFTAEYAAEVSRCGTEVLDAVALSHAELAPYVAAICGRAVACGEVDYAECRQELESGLGKNLERAIGAINKRGRAELRVCLKTIPCRAMGAQIASCLEPIMDRLLWLPG